MYELFTKFALVIILYFIILKQNEISKCIGPCLYHCCTKYHNIIIVMTVIIIVLLYKQTFNNTYTDTKNYIK